MYIGRFIVVGPNVSAYRVSSRSFPNRQVSARGEDTLTVGPTEDAPETDNPYIAYNCVRVTENGAVLGNGSHVDPAAEKLAMGYPARDALAQSLLALDYEKDDYNTPRIAGIMTDDGQAFIGIVRKDALLVEQVEEPTLVATYEEDAPTTYTLDSDTAAEAAAEVYDADYEHAVCAAGIGRDGDGFELAVENGE
ncbi:IMP cyclohydrolase [Haloarchaeobius sp. HME9146]|uniref:IMP cyclohydrolase n=1 Tax=Haloarchaeobius sp. HME9146 TaxID=2978732 RepID=UPI0021C1FE4A|nr:IMP cyclohydrolase [Haloarchaeobius sp. HME9146]MCT9094847.1 IMP cyclohydrolase [Haloarchaeobius sp. HME9146]